MRSDLVLNEEEQSAKVQMNGQSPVWVRRCTVSWDLSLARYGHIWHRKGLSPLCTRRCFFREPDSLQA